MSLRNADGEPIEITLQSGIIDAQRRGCNITDLSDTTKSGPLDLSLNSHVGGGYSCTRDQTFGMPTWLFWTIIAVLAVVIIVVVATNMINPRFKRRHGR